MYRQEMEVRLEGGQEPSCVTAPPEVELVQVYTASEAASANLGLRIEIDRRHAIEVELKRSEWRSTQLLRLSERFQAQRRMLSRQISARMRRNAKGSAGNCTM